ncbi:MAG TPA: ECF-type sigma factor, partial [Fimbriiglobus sp.]|nr:ECF-type sigma factor [Fimbriiglobus sp.]
MPSAPPAATFGRTSDVTRLLDAAASGDPKAAAELLPLVYDELRKLAAVRMAEEKPGQTLQPTALPCCGRTTRPAAFWSHPSTCGRRRLWATPPPPRPSRSPTRRRAPWWRGGTGSW